MVRVGRGWRIPGLVEALGDQVKIPSAPFTSFARLALAPSVDAAAFGEAATSLAVCCGLALQGLGLARVGVNLMLPEAVRARERERKSVTKATGWLLRGLLGRFGASSH